jgi:bifunctional enzyme CysN/CysC
MISRHHETNLHRLEAEAIRIFRETVAEFRNPVLLHSIGKDSSVMLHLARKAFAPDARGIHTTMLNGDNVRLGLNRDLGFTEVDRVENIRRVDEVAKLMTEAGLVALCSFISPFRAERRMVRELVGAQTFIEVFVDTPLQTCIARDPKGLYRRAMAGEIHNFTGIDHAYETPQDPELHLEAGSTEPQTLANQVIEYAMRRVIVTKYL